MSAPSGPRERAPGPRERASVDRIFGVHEFEPIARERMEASAYAYVEGWAGSGWTAQENVEAFRRWVFRPRVLVDVSRIDTTTSILGTPIASPVLFAPTAVHRLAHADGELATARATLALDTIQVLSTLGSATLEEVAAVGHKRWFQLYWFSDRVVTRELIERAAASGYGAIVVTVDAASPAWREREARLPLVFPEGVTQPNVPTDVELVFDPALTWASLEWLRSISPLPIVLKGVLRPDDATRAVAAGVDGIIVSNHGGRQLDGATATLDALPAVVEAVARRIPVLMDGGVRRGTDVLKALALGADAVLLGRLVQWALAAGGDAGILRMMELVIGELRSAMGLCGRPTLASIDRSMVQRNPDPGA